MLAAFVALLFVSQEVRVSTDAELQKALKDARPGVTILIAPGDYQGGIFQSNLQGTAEKPITISGVDPDRRPVFTGGNSGIHIIQPAHLNIRNIVIRNVKGNGLNIDDGGAVLKPAHHINLAKITVSGTPAGNNDGIKLSGIKDFSVNNCDISNWGGSAIDMVGCHNGIIKDSHFENGGDNAIQTKGGSSGITIETSTFLNAGERPVNLGGSTGREFFRPPVNSIKAGQRTEATAITVQGCTIQGGTAGIAFVGATYSAARFNTIYAPKRWAFRILQETNATDFLPCGNNAVESNLIVYQSQNWGEQGINIGSGTQPKSFKFVDNFWYCLDAPNSTRANPNIEESNAIRGIHPHLEPLTSFTFKVAPSSPAAKVGAHAFPIKP
ncbi:MAG: right-handed parallel beta-helix repeat-containing protein [Fimbriimonadaceae bacterium]|nr:MAG: right-handed parallel beta-helix repeat-containing protein [Fimbriimonadaceae bacterium]